MTLKNALKAYLYKKIILLELEARTLLKVQRGIYKTKLIGLKLIITVKYFVVLLNKWDVFKDAVRQCYIDLNNYSILQYNNSHKERSKI